MTYEYNPNYAVHPGSLIVEALDNRGKTQVWLAATTGYTPKHINQVLTEVKPVHAKMAVEVEWALGIPRFAEMLMAMQGKYDVFNARKAIYERANAMREFIEQLPGDADAAGQGGPADEHGAGDAG